MARGLLIISLVVAATLAAATSAIAGRGPASVKVADCSLDDASALFVARMRQVDGTERMGLRFRLLEKAERGFHTLKAPGLGRWRTSKPGVGAFAYKQAVRGLEAGSLYRAEVDFRWFDADGDVIQTDRRRSPACRQFDVLPNLTATPIASRQTTDSGVLRYRVLVTNEGIAPATGVPVRLTVDRGGRGHGRAGGAVARGAARDRHPGARLLRHGEGRGRSGRRHRRVVGVRQLAPVALRRSALTLRALARAPIPSGK